MLVAHQLSKRFGAKVLFDQLHWQLGGAERVGLVGDNGAGKTTLLRLLAGEAVADEGRVVLSQGQRLAYLPQEMPRQTAGTIRARVMGGDLAMLAAIERLQTATERLEGASAKQAAERTEAMLEAQEAYARCGAARFAGRVEQVLMGLGFSRDRFDAPIASLSGGWAMRVELARLLVAEPDYLLMDEPTNHLDQTSLAWLEQFLRDSKSSWVMVSHDHAFLDRTVDSIAALAFGRLLHVRGNHSDYLQYMAAFAKQQAHAQIKRELQMQHLQAFIDRFGAKASKARQAKSKQKALDRLQQDGPAAVEVARHIHFSMRVAQPSAQDAVRVSNIAFSYGERRIVRDASLRIERGERIAIVGANGAGKSTLLRLLSKSLTPQDGQVHYGANLTPYVFGQHQSEALDPSRSVYETLAEAMPHAPTTQIRSLLAAFLFDEYAMPRLVQHLSGGEKNRLALAKMVASPSNFLLLDEPTNHLDDKSRRVLADALASYDGTMVLISHDHRLCERLAQRFVAIRADGSLAEAFSLDAALSACGPQAPVGAAGVADKPNKHARAQQKQAKAQQRKQAKDVARIEERIAQLEARVAEIDRRLMDKATFDDAAAATALLRERQLLHDEELPRWMADWEAAAAQIKPNDGT